MRAKIRHILICFTLLFTAVNTSAQGYSFYENNQFDRLQRQMYRVGDNYLHSSLRQYSYDEMGEVFNIDSVIYDGIVVPEKKMNIWRRFLHDDLLIVRSKKENIYVAVNPMFDLELGKDGDNNTYTNSRGFYVYGNLGKSLWFYMDFTENQATYPEYYMNHIKERRAIPGQGNYKQEQGWDPDFQTATGYLAFRPYKWVDIQIGKTKNFIGDGYRSLLLSDAANAYPQIKLNVKFLNIRYMMMVSQLRVWEKMKVSNDGWRPKYAFTHYLDCNFFGRLSVGLFENVMMCTHRIDGEQRSIDWEYLNPFIIFRPGEMNAGSPDKMLVGINMKFKAANWLTLHGQAVLNEFRAKELFSNSKYWSNKYGFLLGIRTFDLFGLKGLDLTGEYSQVRPFCYSQYEGMATYTHHGESLAHPQGANFREVLGILNYKHKRISTRAQVTFTQWGADIPGDTLSYGHNPNIASNKRNAQYGVELLQGAKTDMLYADVNFAYLINPRSLLNITVGVRHRKEKSDYSDMKTNHVYFAVRWALKQRYYDF